MRGEGKAQFGGLALQVHQFPLPVLLFIDPGSRLVIRHPVFEHVIDRPGNFVRRRDQRLLRPDLGFLASVIGAKGTIAPRDGGSGLTKGLTRAVVCFQGAATQHPSARDIIVGR